MNFIKEDMKKLRLSKNQEKKLLLMFNVLFPEIGKAIEITKSGLICFSKNGNFPASAIHWFEFCFTCLVEKIQSKIPEDQIYREQPAFIGNVYGWTRGSMWTMYSEFAFVYPKACSGGSIYPNNPVDSLYEEFKKLK